MVQGKVRYAAFLLPVNLTLHLWPLLTGRLHLRSVIARTRLPNFVLSSSFCLSTTSSEDIGKPSSKLQLLSCNSSREASCSLVIKGEHLVETEGSARCHLKRGCFHWTTCVYVTWNLMAKQDMLELGFGKENELEASLGQKTDK